MKKILIGIDNSKYAEHAAAYGFNLAHKLKAVVGLVHIVEPIVPVSTMDASMLSPVDTATDFASVDILKAQQEQSENIVKHAKEKYGQDIQVTTFTNYGSTAEGILECSKEFDADIIIVGTHSRSGFDRLLMGSVAEHVVRHATVPVLVVPFPEHED